MPDLKRDVFVCHASEDKETIVRPLVEAFNNASISCWYDEDEIKWGDSIPQQVNDGLANSRYVVVVLSSASIEKKWTQRELNATLNQEAGTGEVRVLPLLVGNEQERRNILLKFPLLNDKSYYTWDGNSSKIVSALESLIKRSIDRSKTIGSGTLPKIPLPKMKKQFSQRDKDIFLRNSFTIIKNYFKDALQELEHHIEGVETDFSEVNNFKFIATSYIRGNVANRCKVWLGSQIYSDSIAYSEGRQISINGDNSYNDWLSVADDSQVLGFNPSGMWFGGQQHSRDKLLSAEQAAEYLWKRFIDKLEQSS